MDSYGRIGLEWTLLLSPHWVLTKEQGLAFLKHNCEHRYLILPDLRKTAGFQKKHNFAINKEFHSFSILKASSAGENQMSLSSPTVGARAADRNAQVTRHLSPAASPGGCCFMSWFFPKSLCSCVHTVTLAVCACQGSVPAAASTTAPSHRACARRIRSMCCTINTFFFFLQLRLLPSPTRVSVLHSIDGYNAVLPQPVTLTVKK